jgi:hypothetical protein
MPNESRFVGDIRWIAYDVFASAEVSRWGAAAMSGIALGAFRCSAEESYALASNFAGRALNISAAPSVISSKS